MNAIRITRSPRLLPTSKAPLTREVWTFRYFENHHALVLDRYESQLRETSRHKFRTTAAYHRLGHDRNVGEDRISEPDVPLPPDVTQEAHAEFSKQLEVLLWSEVSR